MEQPNAFRPEPNSPPPGQGDASPLDEDMITTRAAGYPTTVACASDIPFQTISDEYAAVQQQVNIQKVDRFVLPLLRDIGARRVLDAGCGVGTMVTHLNTLGFDAYGFDLMESVSRWSQLDLPRERFVAVEPIGAVLPFADKSFDAVFSFGAIEHVGTTNGHSERRADYHEVRTAWVRELFRVLRPGGAMLLAGPNRNFPVDVAHGPDSRALGIERWLSSKLRITVHRPWGENFLWGYGDVRRYCADLPCRIEGISIHGYIGFSRVPKPFATLAESYVRRLPSPLLATGFNPWVCALVTRTE